jgi:hypothetical protein
MPRRLPPALVLTALMAIPALGQETGRSDSRTVDGAAARLVLAQRLYLEALNDGAALPLVAAIRLARSVTLRPATGWERATSDTEAMAPLLQGPDPGSEIALTIAQNLAADDPGLQDLVYDLDAQVPQAPNLTAVFVEASLAAGASDSWRLPLFGAVPAELALIGLDGGILSLRVADADDSAACSRSGTAEPQLCRITPERNGFYTVTIRNEGASPAGYRLIGN